MSEDKTVELLRRLADEIENGNHMVSDINYTITKTDMMQNTKPYYLETKENLGHEITIKTVGKAL